ncbi:hypothetical protein SETIT_5G183800v2 [Setaria italica]|uniref:KIB1-4 beta-propeller domain-containing protein n=2 Tax=Setaria TaxID=4554 RepID=A0A368R7X9_SETIT|nr:hypothetical protein SETIT_5G183800v2 [Setaria italica]TKW14724.1 hypothetical protein SEVIR_5G185100v2 [Setaria viridis]RCV25669.1 hypothetical protein SETIT_5G183800v2 [Setaria italica]RCV25670.1 hypothetical protein SETIT_5G183800v2 [Setaria italica]TKW14727.1 hypothetical protein SEVIR_5G185100v2 [Setaria viridis]
MAPWADLPPDLLARIADRLGLKCYTSARGACAAWRRVLAPPAPALLLVAGDGWGQSRPTFAASLPARRSFDLVPFISYNSRCVGSSGSWIALSVVPYLERRAVIVLLNPVAPAEVVLPPLIYDAIWVVSKVVFAPSPAKDDFVAAAICDSDRIAYVTAGARRWAVLGPVCLADGDHFTDLVYHGEGKVYCLTRCGNVHVLHLPERRRRQPATDVSDLFMRRSPECQGEDLNEGATIEPLLSAGNAGSNPVIAFATPYDIVSAVTGAKNLVMCEGNLYQVWRNTSCTVSLQLPGGGRRRTLENEIFVLRYYPQRQPCWDVVKDLRGYSFFIGRNNAMSMCAEGVPGIRANCVYWIGGNGEDQGMVFDMETGRSTSCITPVITVPGHQQRTVCWYLLNDMVTTTTSSSNRGRRNTPTAATE